MEVIQPLLWCHECGRGQKKQDIILLPETTDKYETNGEGKHSTHYISAEKQLILVILGVSETLLEGKLFWYDLRTCI